MGKNVPLRIGRKSKRELNPVEKMRKKEKHKKNIKQFLKKINQKANGEFKSKVKPRRSPSPESNDPMLGQLISASKLRMNNLPPVPDFEDKEESIASQLEIIKANPNSFVPVVLNKKVESIQDNSSDSSDSESDYVSMKLPLPKCTKVNQNQEIYKTFLESDSKLTDFFNDVRDLL